MPPNDQMTILYGLGDMVTDYTVFEPNQVLSDKQLNGVTSYLDDQERLTRIELLGVGIVGGLRVDVVDGDVRIRNGVGVTTNGDLLMLEQDTAFDRFKPYGTSAPRYEPFYPNNQMMQLFELVALTYKLQPGDAGIVKPLSNLPGKLTDWVVVMLMESYLKDSDLCSGTDCDNLGLDAVHKVRFLLASQADADKLLVKLKTDSEDSLGVERMVASRVEINGPVGTYANLAKLYRGTCGAIHANIVSALPSLDAKLWQFLVDLFGYDPIGGWNATLKSIRDNAADARIQYYYDFLKDVVETWNALREVLHDDDVVLCPPMEAFPKHLLLGSLANPRAYRTDFYPSPLTTHGGNAYEHARFLAGKLHTLINTYASPADAAIVITPSRMETMALEDRAIPYYYATDKTLPIQSAWNYRRSRRGDDDRNLGYRSKSYSNDPDVTEPLDYQIGAFDFFRIEGHQGQDIKAVMKALQDQITQHDLPICLRAVALRSEKTPVTIKPPFWYTELYDIHQLLRKDVATLIQEAEKFGGVFEQGIDTALKLPGSLLPQVIDNVATTVVAGDSQKAVQDAVKTAIAPFQAAGYADYLALRQQADSVCGYKDLVTAAGKFGEAFGDMARKTLATPFDDLMMSRTRAWIDWLDRIIDNNNKQRELELLFDNYIKTNQGLEHFGGVCRGGTFVVVYDENDRVVADFSLPYCCCADKPQRAPIEVTLPDVPIKPPVDIKDGPRILPPWDEIFGSKLKDIEDKLRGEWQKDVAIQKDYFNFFKDSVDAFSQIVGTAVTNPVVIATGAIGAAAEAGGRFADKLLGALVQTVNEGVAEVQRLRDILTDPTLAGGARDQATTLLRNAETNLATSIATATNRAASAGVDLATAGGDGAKAFAALAGAMGGIADPKVRDSLGKALQTTQQAVQGAGQTNAATAIGNLIKQGGFRI